MNELETGHKDIVEARKFIYAQMVKVSNGDISIEKGLAIHKLAGDLMEGYRIQVKAMELIALNSSKEVTMESVTKQLESKQNV